MSETDELTIDALRGSRIIAAEARCQKCGESFNPDLHDDGDDGDYLGPDDEGRLTFRHYQRFGPDENGEYETECGGVGVFTGAWGPR